MTEPANDMSLRGPRTPHPTVWKPLGQWVDHRQFARYLFDDQWCYQIVHPVTLSFPAYAARLRQLSGAYWQTHTDGTIDVRAGYCWDGPSGPAINDEASVVASLVHDILCTRVLARPRRWLYPCGYFRAHRLYRMVCRAQGMPAFRAWYQWTGLVLFNWMVRLRDMP